MGHRPPRLPRRSLMRSTPHARSDRMPTLVAKEPALGSQRWHRRCRSEEHTSELQSLMRISYAVLCLKITITNNHYQDLINNIAENHGVLILGNYTPTYVTNLTL